jgi:hypothetical protein
MLPEKNFAEGRNVRDRTSRLPINSQFEVIRAKSVAIERTHVDAVRVCSGAGRRIEGEDCRDSRAGHEEISEMLLGAKDVSDRGGFFAPGRNAGISPGISRDQSTAGTCCFPVIVEIEDT